MKFYLRVDSGMGDILMLCGVAKALKGQGHELHLCTSRAFVEMARRCSYFASVVSDDPTGMLYKDPDSLACAMAEIHQIDATLIHLGKSEYIPSQKAIHLDPLPSEKVSLWLSKLPTGPRVLIHASKGDPNRSYQHWQSVADLLNRLGLVIIEMGKESEKPNDKSVYRLTGVHSAVNEFSILETLELIRGCDCLVSTDSGPLHLAGSTRTKIVGLYTTVLGKNRVPYGAENRTTIIQGECPLAGCYPLSGGVAREGFWTTTWCPAGSGYACLKSITPEKIVAAVIKSLLYP